jgi:acetyl esterase
MPLDEEAREAIAQAMSEGIREYQTMSVEEARRARLMRVRPVPESSFPLRSVVDRTIPGPGGDLPVRIYTPAGDGPLPVLVYFHGGGWVVGNIDSVDHVCRDLGHDAGCVVVSVAYRRAPEHRFPAAAEDAYAATLWAARNAAELGGDPEGIAVGGDSAGGNLAAVAALMARDRGGPKLLFQLLLWPIIDFAFDTPSYRECAEGYLLTRAEMRWFWDHYLASEADGRHPYASPIRAESLGGLPPALVLTAEFDPLRDEGEAYAARLAEAGVRATAVRMDGTIHGFMTRYNLPDNAGRGLELSASALRQAFKRPD